MMYDLDVEGAGQLIDRLQKFDKDVYKILQKEIRAASEMVAANARRRVPDDVALSNWGPWQETTGSSGVAGSIIFQTSTRGLEFDGADVRRMVKTQVRKTRQRGVGTTGIEGRVVMASAAGAIWSLAGSRNTSGSEFNTNLNAKWGISDWPRALTPALHAEGPKAGEQIDRAIERAKAAVT